MLVAVVNQKHTVRAEHVAGLKRQASRAANNDFNVIDSMTVHEEPVSKLLGGRTVTYIRVNKKLPNGHIQRGQWN